MTKSLIYLPEAAGDVGEAYAYYEERVTGLGDEFLEQLRIRTAAIREIAVEPEMAFCRQYSSLVPGLAEGNVQLCQGSGSQRDPSAP